MARVKINQAVFKVADGTAATATVTVRLRGTVTNAQLYDANNATIANPTSTAAGRIEAYVDEGRYDLVVSGAGFATYTQQFEAVAPLSTDSVTGNIIANDAITTIKLLDGAVTNPKIANNAVDAGKIASDSIITAKILDANVTATKIADLAVTTSKVADLAVTTAKLADVNVTTGKLADLNVTTGKLAANAVTAAKVEVQQGWLVATNSSATGTCYYMKDSLGFVHVQCAGAVGMTAPIGAGAVMFTLPAGYRPGSVFGVPLASTTTFNSVQSGYMDTGGAIRYTAANGGAGAISFYIPPLIFRAEN